MPSDVPLPIELDQLPLVARTDIRDVRLVSIEAQAPDVPAEDAAVHFAMDEMAYRVEAGTLFVRVDCQRAVLRRGSGRGATRGT